MIKNQKLGLSGEGMGGHRRIHIGRSAMKTSNSLLNILQISMYFTVKNRKKLRISIFFFQNRPRKVSTETSLFLYKSIYQHFKKVFLLIHCHKWCFLTRPIIMKRHFSSGFS